MPLEHEVYEVTCRLLAHHGATPSDLAGATQRSQSAIHRTLTGNPTVRILKEVAWALGLGEQYHWLCLPLKEVPKYLNTTFHMSSDCEVKKYVIRKMDRKLTTYATHGRGPDFDPTDKQMLGEVYPAKAIAGANGAPIDSRFIVPEPEPTPYGKSMQGPGGAARAQHAEAPDPLDTTGMVEHPEYGWMDADTETPKQRQARLSQGAPDGYLLSPKALADAPRTPFTTWLKGGWDIDGMIHHGYLESTGDDTADQPPATYKGDDPVTNAVEAQRIEASIGCPDGWILSDKALEVEGATYEKLEQAMGLAKLKEDRYLVPRAWLGYN